MSLCRLIKSKTSTGHNIDLHNVKVLSDENSTIKLTQSFGIFYAKKIVKVNLTHNTNVKT